MRCAPIKMWRRDYGAKAKNVCAVSAVPVLMLFLGAWLAPASVRAQAAKPQVSGAEIYATRCASCHEQAAVTRAPGRAALRKMTVARIVRTLDFGIMMGIAYPLNRDQREAVAKYLGTSGSYPAPLASAYCSASAGLPGGTSGRAVPLRGPSAAASASWNGWSPAASNTRFQTSEQAGLTAAQVPQLKLKWAYGFAGDVTAFASPTVVNGTVYMGSAGGAVQALDAKTGCLRWIFQANGPVRSAIILAANGVMPNGAAPNGSARNGRSASLLFGDQIGWFYSLDPSTGRLLWKKRVEEHEATRLTGSPAALNGVVFVPAASWEESRALDPNYACCTSRGNVTALRVRDGALVWKAYMVDKPVNMGRTNSVGAAQWGPSGISVWSAPTVDTKRGLLYVTTGNLFSGPPAKTSDALVALDLKSGKIMWSQEATPGDVYTSACRGKGANCPPEDGPDYDFGSPAMLLRDANGRDVLVAGQKSGVVFGFDPDQNGKILWQTRVGAGGRNGGVQWGMTSDGSAAYAAVSDMATTLNTNGPVGSAKFDPAVGGGLTALRIADGSKIWFAAPKPCDPPRPGCSPAQSQALTSIPGVVFSGSVDGHLRAFATADGKVIWDVDTAKEYDAMNGVQAKGGSLDGAGPVVAGGMVFVNSGYPRTGGMPGNVLLAFGVE